MTRGNLNPGESDPNKAPAIAITAAATATVGQPVSLTARVTDDGLPKPRVPVQRRRRQPTPRGFRRRPTRRPRHGREG